MSAACAVTRAHAWLPAQKAESPAPPAAPGSAWAPAAPRGPRRGQPASRVGGRRTGAARPRLLDWPDRVRIAAMSPTRLLSNLLLVLAILALVALVASRPLPVSVAAHAASPATSAPCHDTGEPVPPADTHHEGGDCCGGEPGHCGCDCLQPLAAAPWRPQRASHPAPAALEAFASVHASPRSPASPDTRPPIV